MHDLHDRAPAPPPAAAAAAYVRALRREAKARRLLSRRLAAALELAEARLADVQGTLGEALGLGDAAAGADWLPAALAAIARTREASAVAAARRPDGAAPAGPEAAGRKAPPPPASPPAFNPGRAEARALSDRLRREAAERGLSALVWADIQERRSRRRRG